MFNKKIIIISLVFILTLLGFFISIFLRKSNFVVIDESIVESLKEEEKVEELKDFKLIIPIIDIEAPLIFDVDGSDEEIYDKVLEHGVAQMAGTKKPGEKGNIFIFGHSCFYKDQPGEYKNIFRKLDQLKEGDKIILSSEDKEYIYDVFGSKIINSEDLSVLDPTPENLEDETLTLMTCWPPCTTIKRLVVFATRE